MSAGGTSTSTPRGVAPLWGFLGIAGAAGWAVTVTTAQAMGVGPGTMDMGAGPFGGMWVAMMAAMMLPAIGIPAARAGLRAGSGAASRVTRTLGFGAGFLVPWVAFGAVAFAALEATEHLVASAPDAARWLGVGIVGIAAAYQLSPWKQRALEHCRASMASHGGAFASGLRDGAVCVGCCWALMSVLVATGIMSLPAMAGLAAVIFAEKVLPRPRLIARLAGATLLALAVASAFAPSLLAGVRAEGADMPAHVPPPAEMPAEMDAPMGGM
ncbi:MAG: DUF2182 domain-containing protein [Actinomycetota bacterium]